MGLGEKIASHIDRAIAVACDVRSAAFNQNMWQKCVAFAQEKMCLNYCVPVERTAKPLQYGNRLSVGINIL